MPDNTGGEKTLPASPQKKQRAREEGNVPKSQDLNSAAALGMALLALLMFGQFIAENILEAVRYFLGHAHELRLDELPLRTLAGRVLYFVARGFMPMAGVMLVTGVLLNFFQVGFLMSSKALQPKWGRLNPLSGFGRFFSTRSLVELAKSLSKLTLVSYIVYLSMRTRLGEFPTLMEQTPWILLPAVANLVVAVWWRVALAMLVIGIVDLGFQRWQHEQDLKMTVQEAKQETKEMEGDPHVKRRIKQLQRQIATQRMMAEVPEADVVITNPTRYAVALRYDIQNMRTPTVVAKGERLMAQRIRDLATEHNVPIVQKPELARALYRTLEVGQPIPEDLFHAVAEVLSFVYQIDRRVEKMRERRGILRDMQRAAV